MIESPMLAAALTRAPRFPVLATPKIDGIRCFTAEGEARTRSGVPLPNDFARAWIGRHCPDGFDGELTVRGLTPHAASAALMRAGGRPDFAFHVFDFVFDSTRDPYAQRIAELARLEWAAPGRNRVVHVLPSFIADQPALDAFEARCLAEGFEGVCLRDPHSPYAAGQSTAREGWLLKLKRFADREAEVIGADARALICRDGARTFRIGTGFTAADRAALFAQPHLLPGRLVKYREQRTGAVRSRVFLSLRDVRDLDSGLTSSAPSAASAPLR